MGVRESAGGNPGVGANWSIYPDTGWVGVILSNRDGVPLREMVGWEMQAITGASPGGGVVAEVVQRLTRREGIS